MSAASEEIVLTRQELYERVWSKAMCLLAKEYGLSDQGLAKTCKRHRIPVPPRGYWAKKAVGKKPRQLPLPPCDEAALQTITLWRAPKDDDLKPQPVQSVPNYDPDVVEALYRARALPDDIVPDQLRNPHPLVRDFLDEKRREGGSLNINVFKGSRPRVARIMDGLIKTVESLGGKVVIEKKQWRHITVLYLLERKVTALYLREGWHKTARDPKDPDYTWFTRDKMSTGQLTLERDRFDSEHRHSYVLCCDTPKKRCLEGQLKPLLIRFVEQVGIGRIRDRRVEEARLKYEAEERIRREREAEIERQRQHVIQRQKEEQARVDSLMNQALAWYESRILREYVHAVQEEGIRRHGSIDSGSELDLWLKWALVQADRLDPLVPSPPSILDEKV